VRLEKADIEALKRARPLDGLVAARARLGRENGRGIRAGACLCSPKRGKSPLWVNGAKGTWGCLAGACGGDTFSYLQQWEGLDFKAALEFLGGREAVADPATIAEAEAARKQREDERMRREAELAEADRRRAFEMWQRGVRIEGTLAAAYFRHRGLDVPASKALRFVADEPYWVVADDSPHEHGRDGGPVVVHRGPCLLAAIQGMDGRFIGLHRTWLDPRLDSSPGEGFSGKARIVAQDGTPLAAKKMRGGKQGGAIRLHMFAGGGAERVLIAGEGIETVETGYQALATYAPGPDYAAWAAGDLGNLSGRGLGPSEPHPTLPNRRVPPAEPDPAAPGMMPPDGTIRAILLGDGDSDPYVTRARLECAKARWEAAGVPTEIRMAPAGADFNDLVRPGADLVRECGVMA
jgi:hypothetical protein